MARVDVIFTCNSPSVRLDPILTRKPGYLRGSLFTDTTRVRPKPVLAASWTACGRMIRPHLQLAPSARQSYDLNPVHSWLAQCIVSRVISTFPVLSEMNLALSLCNILSEVKVQHLHDRYSDDSHISRANTARHYNFPAGSDC